MKYDVNSVEGYLEAIPEERKVPFNRLRDTILSTIPEGFEEQFSYGMIGYVVPFSRYPQGYHADPSLPLPFCNIASQKNYIALYHSGLYSDPELLKWFTDEYPKYSSYKLDMGKSCVRFKRMDDIPYPLIGELMSKVTVDDWIKTYESVFQDRHKKK